MVLIFFNLPWRTSRFVVVAAAVAANVVSAANAAAVDDDLEVFQFTVPDQPQCRQT